MHDMGILRRAAHMLKTAIFSWGDDAKDYFTQLAMAGCDLHKLNIVFLVQASDEWPEGSIKSSWVERDGNRLFFVTELRLGFGTHGASNIAQRFSEALLAMFRQDMDQNDAEFNKRGLSPELDQWLDARARVARELVARPDHLTRENPVHPTHATFPREHFGGPEDPLARATLEQSRLYAALMYTVRAVCPPHTSPCTTRGRETARRQQGTPTWYRRWGAKTGVQMLGRPTA